MKFIISILILSTLAVSRRWRPNANEVHAELLDKLEYHGYPVQRKCSDIKGFFKSLKCFPSNFRKWSKKGGNRFSKYTTTLILSSIAGTVVLFYAGFLLWWKYGRNQLTPVKIEIPEHTTKPRRRRSQAWEDRSQKSPGLDLTYGMSKDPREFDRMGGKKVRFMEGNDTARGSNYDVVSPRSQRRNAANLSGVYTDDEEPRSSPFKSGHYSHSSTKFKSDFTTDGEL